MHSTNGQRVVANLVDVAHAAQRRSNFAADLTTNPLPGAATSSQDVRRELFSFQHFSPGAAPPADAASSKTNMPLLSVPNQAHFVAETTLEAGGGATVHSDNVDISVSASAGVATTGATTTQDIDSLARAGRNKTPSDKQFAAAERAEDAYFMSLLDEIVEGEVAEIRRRHDALAELAEAAAAAAEAERAAAEAALIASLRGRRRSSNSVSSQQGGGGGDGRDSSPHSTAAPPVHRPQATPSRPRTSVLLDCGVAEPANSTLVESHAAPQPSADHREREAKLLHAHGKKRLTAQPRPDIVTPLELLRNTTPSLFAAYSRTVPMTADTGDAHGPNPTHQCDGGASADPSSDHKPLRVQITATALSQQSHQHSLSRPAVIVPVASNNADPYLRFGGPVSPILSRPASAAGAGVHLHSPRSGPTAGGFGSNGSGLLHGGASGFGVGVGFTASATDAASTVMTNPDGGIGAPPSSSSHLHAYSTSNPNLPPKRPVSAGAARGSFSAQTLLAALADKRRHSAATTSSNGSGGGGGAGGGSSQAADHHSPTSLGRHPRGGASPPGAVPAGPQQATATATIDATAARKLLMQLEVAELDEIRAETTRLRLLNGEADRQAALDKQKKAAAEARRAARRNRAVGSSSGKRGGATPTTIVTGGSVSWVADDDDGHGASSALQRGNTSNQKIQFFVENPQHQSRPATPSNPQPQSRPVTPLTELSPSSAHAAVTNHRRHPHVQQQQLSASGHALLDASTTSGLGAFDEARATACRRWALLRRHVVRAPPPTASAAVDAAPPVVTGPNSLVGRLRAQLQKEAERARRLGRRHPHTAASQRAHGGDFDAVSRPSPSRTASFRSAIGDDYSQQQQSRRTGGLRASRHAQNHRTGSGDDGEFDLASSISTSSSSSDDESAVFAIGMPGGSSSHHHRVRGLRQKMRDVLHNQRGRQAVLRKRHRGVDVAADDIVTRRHDTPYTHHALRQAFVVSRVIDSAMRDTAMTVEYLQQKQRDRLRSAPGHSSSQASAKQQGRRHSHNSEDVPSEGASSPNYYHHHTDDKKASRTVQSPPYRSGSNGRLSVDSAHSSDLDGSRRHVSSPLPIIDIRRASSSCDGEAASPNVQTHRNGEAAPTGGDVTSAADCYGADPVLVAGSVAASPVVTFAHVAVNKNAAASAFGNLRGGTVSRSSGPAQTLPAPGSTPLRVLTPTCAVPSLSIATMARMFRQQSAVESALGTGGGMLSSSSRASDPTLGARSDADEGADDDAATQSAEMGDVSKARNRDAVVESKWHGAPSMVLRDELKSAAVLAAHRGAIEAAVAKHMKRYEGVAMSHTGSAAAGARKAAADMAKRNAANRERLQEEQQQIQKSRARRPHHAPLSLQSIAAADAAAAADNSNEDFYSTAAVERETLNSGGDGPDGRQGVSADVRRERQGVLPVTLASLDSQDADMEVVAQPRRRPLSADRFVAQVAARLGVGSAAYRKFYRPISEQRRHDAAVSRAVAQCLAAPYTAAVVRADAVGREHQTNATSEHRTPARAVRGDTPPPALTNSSLRPLSRTSALLPSEQQRSDDDDQDDSMMAVVAAAAAPRTHMHGFWCHLHVVSPFHPPIYARVFVPTETAETAAKRRAPSSSAHHSISRGGSRGAASRPAAAVLTEPPVLLAEDWVVHAGHPESGAAKTIKPSAIDVRLLPIVQAVLAATESALPPSFAARMPLRVASAAAAAAAAASANAASAAPQPLRRAPASTSSLCGLGAFAPPPREWVDRNAVPLLRLEQLRTASCRDPSRDGSSNVVIVVDAVSRT